MNTVKVRNIEIGAGIPKVCAPIVGETKEDIIAEAKAIMELPVDVVEWRADWYEDGFDFMMLEEVLKELREVLGDTPLLLTYRTVEEGGQIDLCKYGYPNIITAGIKTGCVDMVDVQLFRGPEQVNKIVTAAREHGVKVVMSNHDFNATPEKDEIIARLRQMQDLGADIPKIAVMPKSPQDVITLLAATEEMTRLYADRPIITMSMSGTGVISRLAGEVFGSALTFGAAKKASAPGQIGVNDLRSVLELLHGTL